jgi:NOL1/NOP2/fmu family ribosome biogenesis protein
MSSHKCGLYIGIFEEKGIVVDKESAYRYAMERVVNGTPEVQQEFVEWFYSGNWIEEEDNG